MVAGALEDNELPLATAQRETKEELGIQAKNWIDLGVFDLDTSIVYCPVHLFLEKHLSLGQTQREETETIETYKMPFIEALRMVMEGVLPMPQAVY